MASVNDAVMLAGRRAGHDRVGAAIAVVRCIPGRVVISHAGDVRIYRLRRGETHLLTRDHNVATELSSAGRDLDSRRCGDRQDRRAHLLPRRRRTRGNAIHSGVLDARHGDRLVICSDGVHRPLDRNDWVDVQSSADCQLLVDELVGRSEAKPQHRRPDRRGDHARVGDVSGSGRRHRHRGPDRRRCGNAHPSIDGDPVRRRIDAAIVDAFVGSTDAGQADAVIER